MTKEQIEFHISRLLSGEFILDGEEDFLFVKNADKRSILIADKLSKEHDLGMTQPQLDKFLRDNGYWTMNDDVDFSRLQESLKDLKLELWYEDVSKRDLVRARIKKVKDIIGLLSQKLHSYDYLLQSYMQLSLKNKHILSRSIYNEKSERVSIDDIYLSIDNILSQYFSIRCNDEQLREISLSEPWRLFWGAAKANGGTIFAGVGSDLSDEQISILSWTQFFEGVREHPEFPGEEVLLDTDLFDGWCYHQKNKQSGEIDKRDINARIPDNIKGCGEIFLVRQHAKNSDEEIDSDKQSFISKVEQFNDGLAKGAKAARSKAIKEKGIVSESDLPDNQRDIAMQFATRRG